MEYQGLSPWAPGRQAPGRGSAGARIRIGASCRTQAPRRLIWVLNGILRQPPRPLGASIALVIVIAGSLLLSSPVRLE